ncbi:flagellar protein FlaG [Candidimonas sp. SYP-B2681]|uniref:flagellar protein FlaG n=1 Tax=Candidimonas sp. SYP-B2681 TaxID=2497686 RepID=UPI000F871668|nr:flagellar protein FlaG [Candidimonas sp. SYP-B2681]RTZ47572.1 flagellar protein FlaG [Candidimonas sp. SYP-B2681]
MVNLVASNAAAMPYAATSTELESPALPPDPAVQVTAGSETRDSGTATSNKSGGAQPDGSDSLDKALEAINKNMGAWSTGMRFDIDEDAQRVVVSIIDSETGEILRTVPSDAVIRIAKMIVQLQGKSIDTRV